MNRHEAIEIMQEVVTRCAEVFPCGVHDAYLYGSYARGDFDAESDVDILLTVNMSQDQIAEHRRELAHISSDLSLLHDVTVSVAVKPLTQFRQFAEILPYYQNVLREGVRYAV